MPFRLSFLAVAVAAALPLSVLAQSGATATDLDTVVVTGTRTALTVDDALAAVEVIDREQIERSQARSLPELLRGRAGITLVNQGGLGKLTTLFMRGAESDHTLFLVDGVRVGSATSGLTAITDLPVELIERIEIVRGPRSSLYGSEAIGGVIQVFTRRGASGVTPHFKLGGGSHGLREAGGGVDFGFGRGWFGVDYNHQASDGFQACRGAGFPVFAGCFVDNPDPDRDGYESNAVSMRAGFRPTDALTIEAQGLRAEGNNAYDADPLWGLPDQSDTVQQVVGGKVRYQPGERVALQVTAGRNRDRSDNSRDGSAISFFESTRDGATLQGDFGVATGHLLTLGFDWSRDRGSVGDAFSGYAAERGNRAGFVQYQGRLETGSLGAHDLQASLRRDDNDQFGGHTTGGLAWGLDFGAGLRLTANLGTAFKAPSFNELYFPFFGNPGLLPETSESAELGFGQRRDGWRWQLSAFRTDIDDLITYDTAIASANNLEQARIRGAELTGGIELAGWDVSTSASWVDPRNRSPGANFDRLLPRRARTSARIDLDRAFGDFRFGASWVGEGERYDDVANTLRLPGYATIDLRAEYALHPAWTLQARVANAFDRDYETAAYYSQPGREYGLALRYRPAR
jgi:vitamin B12 transporter